MSYHKNSGSFTKGQKAWNKQNIYKTCIVCGKKFKTTKSRFNQQKFCSKECQYKYKRKDTKRFKIYNLYKQGKTYREIADLIGMKIGSICHYIYTEGLRERWGNDISGFSYREALKKKLGIKECELCGYNRITEVAHIIEAKNGGKYMTDNCLILCPNCHTLFDKGQLNSKEIKKLFQIKRVEKKLTERFQNYAEQK